MVSPSLAPTSFEPPDPAGWPVAERVVAPPLPPGDPDARLDGDAPRNPKVLRSRSLDDDAARPPRRSDTAPLIAWFASLVVLAALVFSAYTWRNGIMAAWPPSERLYAALGLSRAAGDVSR